ncbi:PRC-barrel domain-containing protein [Azospirillum soli]|uniref:PRC-barrel domain-containing protein n=1 Tax=Azospirillum soli TaxID=1304799 RepID=UPI001AE6A62F|nr:PRC-barrel domain-containing protein [Azospirillum soli]MBP2313377.1 hypothetical protein [Azospirillum soli]
MKMLMTTCGVAALLISAPTFAADNVSKTATKASPQVAATNEHIDPALARMNASDLKGKNVYGRDGKDMAEIEGVVRKGNRTYAVLDVDHVADISNKDVVLPLDKFHMKGDRLTLDMSKSQLNKLEKWQQGKYEDVKGAVQ